MKNILTITLVLISFLAKADYWTQKADIPGVPRGEAGAFSIGNYGYTGTGQSGANFLDDFWQYDPSLDQWLQKANFPGGVRNESGFFSIGNEGYIALGGPNAAIYNDIWEYDVTNNTWSQKANFPGVKREGCFAFTINTKGYLGCGYDDNTGNDLKDCWEYDQPTNAWTQKADYGGQPTYHPTGFSILGLGYVGGGTVSKEFWKYLPAFDTWIQIANYPGLGFGGLTSFVINNEGYVGLGFVNGGPGNGYKDDLWKYDPLLGVWCQKTSFPGGARFCTNTFTINNKAYVGQGDGIAGYLTDLWEYTPDSFSCPTSINDLSLNSLMMKLCPNPATEDITISFSRAINTEAILSVYDEIGNEVYKQESFIQDKARLPVSNLHKGIYAAVLSSNRKRIVEKFVKQ